MLNDLILTIRKYKLPYINQLKHHLTLNLNFYHLFVLYIFRKTYINNLFIWKISNFSDLYWFFYTLKDVKTLKFNNFK